MSVYSNLIAEIAPDLDAAAVEASMRLQYSTLNHLPRSVFQEECEIARLCEKKQPGFLAGVKRSMGYNQGETDMIEINNEHCTVEVQGWRVRLFSLENGMTYMNYNAETAIHTLANAPLYAGAHDLECYIEGVAADECCSLRLTPGLRETLEDGELLGQIMDSLGVPDYDMEDIASDMYRALSDLA